MYKKKTMKGFGEPLKSKKKRVTNEIYKLSKEQLIKQSIEFHSQGNIRKAAKLYQYFISQGFSDHRVYANYGTILKNLGKSKEAEQFTRKAIEINPNLIDAHLNLGNILKDLGKSQEAILSYRKAIELNPNFTDAYLNLGNVLKDLGKSQEAILSYRKAIELNPEFSISYHNLGNTLRDIGKLEEAAFLYKKAIKLNPNFTDAYLNLINILIDLGKLQESINISKSSLEENSSNKEYQFFTSLQITIANLIRGNFSEILLIINKTRELINDGVINTIQDENNKKRTLTFFRFITSLYPLLRKENKSSESELIPHVGESHCLSFAHQTLSISSKLKQIQPVFIAGAKAWHFANAKNNQKKDSLKQQLKNHTYSDTIFISFGEIDCRKDEGILNYTIKNNKDISEVCKETILGYMNYMEEMLSTNYSKRYYFGIPAPTREKELPDELDSKRIEMVKLYNSLLKQEVLSRGSHFLDVYALTSTKNGENNNLHMCDDIHLSPKCLSILFENYLHKN